MAEMSPLQARQSNCVTRLRDLSSDLLRTRSGIKQLREQFGEAASAGIDGGAFAGTNADLSAADIGAALATFSAVESLLTNADGTPTDHLNSLLKLSRVS